MERDQEILGIILELEKNMVKNYATALTEASNDKLTNEFLTSLTDISDVQRQVYNYMSKQGWYQIEEAKENKITQDETKCNKILEGLEEI